MVEINNTIKTNFQTTGLEDAIQKLNKLNKERQELENNKNIDINVKNKKLNELQKEISKVTQELGQSSKSADHLSRGIENVYSAKAQQAIDRLERDLKSVSNQADKFQKTIDRIDLRQLSQANKTLLDTERALKNNNTAADQLRKNFGISMMQTATFGGINMLGNVFSDALEQVKDIDKVLTDIRLVSQKTTEEMKAYSEYAGEAAGKLGSTKKELLEGNLIFEQQGGQAAQYAKQYGEQVVIGSNISGESTEDVSQYLTSTMNGMDLINKKGANAAKYVNDIYGQIGAVSGSDYGELAKAQAQFANIGSNSGFNLEQTSAMSAVISEITRKAPEAVGTAMKSTLATFQQLGKDKDGETTSKVQTAFKDAGLDIQLKKANGEMRKTEEIFNELGDKWKDLNDDQKGMVSSAIAGKHHGESFQALMNNWDRYQELYEEAKNSEGAALRQQEVYMDSIEAKMNKLKNTWQEYVTSLGASDGFKSVVGLAQGFADQMSAGESSVMNIAKGLTPIVNAFNQFYGKQKLGETVRDREINKTLQKEAETPKGKQDITSEAYWVKNGDGLNDKQMNYVNSLLKSIKESDKFIGELNREQNNLTKSSQELEKQSENLNKTLVELSNSSDAADDDLAKLTARVMELSKKDIDKTKDKFYDMGEYDNKGREKFLQEQGFSGQESKDINQLYRQYEKASDKVNGDIKSSLNYENVISNFKNGLFDDEAFDLYDSINKDNLKGIDNFDKLDNIVQEYIQSVKDGAFEEDELNMLRENLKDDLSKYENSLADVNESLLNKEYIEDQLIQKQKEELAKKDIQKDRQQAISDATNKAKELQKEKQAQLETNSQQIISANKARENAEVDKKNKKETLTSISDALNKGGLAEKISGLTTSLAQSATSLIGTFQAIQEHGGKMDEEFEDIVSSGLMNFGTSLMAINPILGGIVTLLGPILDGLNAFKSSIEEVREANDKLNEVYLAQNEKLNAKRSTLNDNEEILKKYGNMSEDERQGALAENEGDKEKWDGAMEQIATQYPELVSGLDENGKAIVDLQNGYDGLKEKIDKETLENNKMLANNAQGFGMVAKYDLEQSQGDIYKNQAKVMDAQEKLSKAQSDGDAEKIAEASAELSKYTEKLEKARQTLSDTKTTLQTNVINPVFDSNEAFQQLEGEARRTATTLKGDLFNSDTVESMLQSGMAVGEITDKMKNLADNSAKLAKQKGFKELQKNIDAQDYIDLTSNSKKGVKRLENKQKDLSDKDKSNDRKHNENAGLKYAKEETKEYKNQEKAIKKKEDALKKVRKEQEHTYNQSLLTAKTGAADNQATKIAKDEKKSNKKIRKAEEEVEAEKYQNLTKALHTLTPAYAEASEGQQGFKESSQELTQVLNEEEKAQGDYQQSLQDTAFAMKSGMAESNDTFFQEWVAGSEAMVAKINDLYGVDLRNFQDAASAKAAIMASIQGQANLVAQSIASGDSEKETNKKLNNFNQYMNKNQLKNMQGIADLSKDGATYKGKDGKTYKNDNNATADAVKAQQDAYKAQAEAQKKQQEENKKKADEQKRKDLEKQLEDAEKEAADNKKQEEEEKPYNQFQALDKEADKYYAITEALNEMNRAYDKIKRARDNAYSTDKLAIMEQEEQQLKNNIEVAKTAESVYSQEKNRTQQALAAKGFTFDENGTISNKNAILDKMTSDYNNRAMQLNQQKESPEAQQEMENRQQAIEDTEKLIQEYDEANSSLKEQQDNIEEIKQQLSDLQAEKYEIKINIIGDAIDQQAKIIDTLNEINKTEDTFSADNAARNQTKAQASLSQFNMAKDMYNEVKNDPKLTDAAREEKMKELTGVMTSSAQEAMSAVEEVNDEIDRFIDKLSNEFETINKNVDRIMERAQGLADINGKIYGEDSDQYLEQVQNLNKLKDAQDDISRAAIASYKKQQEGIDTTTEKGKERYQELQDLINAEEDKMSQNFNDRLDNAQAGMEALTNKVIEKFDDAGSHIDRALSTLDKLNDSYGNIYGEDSEEFNKQEEQVQAMREVQMEHARDTIKYFKQQQAMIDKSTKSGKEQWEQYQQGIEAAEDLLVDGMITTLEELNDRMKRINETVMESFNKAYDQTSRIVQKTNEYKDAFLSFSGDEFSKDYSGLLGEVNQARLEQNKVSQDAIDFYKTQMSMIDTSTKAGKEQYEAMQKEIEKMGDSIQKNLTDGMKEYESAMKSITNETIKRFKEIASITAKVVSKQNQLSNMAKQVYGATSDQYLSSMGQNQAMRDEQDKIAQQTIQFYKQQQSELDLTTKAGKEQWQQYQDGIEEAQELISNNLSQALSDLQAQMEAMNQKTLKEFKNAFGTDGLDNLQNEYTMQNKAQEKYLSGLEKANVLSSKRAEIQEKMSHSQNNEEIAMYNKYLEEVLEPLENAKTINQSDLEIAQAKLEVAKAELEVKRQGDADMQTRLVRDSQGNMTYEYYQKQSQEGQDAIAKYNNALDNLQEKMRSTVKSTAQEIQDTFANMQNIIQKMAETNDAEERKRLQKQLEAYQQYYNQLMEEYKKYSTMFSAEQVQGAFDKMNQGAISADQLGQSMGVSEDTVNAMNKANQNGMGFDQMASMSQEDLSSQLGISMEEAGAAQQGLQNGGGMDIQSLSSMIQNMYDTWQAKSEETLNKLNDNYNSFTEKSNQIFNDATEDVNQYASNAKDAFEKINGKMSQYVEQSQSAFAKLKSGYNDLADEAKKSMDDIDKSVDKSYIKLAKDSVSQFKKASEAFSDFANTVKSKSKSAFNSAEKEFSDYNDKFKSQTNSMLKNVNSQYNKFKNVASEAISDVNRHTKNLTSSSNSLEKQMGEQKKAADRVKSSANEQGKALKDLKSKNDALAKTIREQVNTAFTGSKNGNGKSGMFGAMTKNSNYAKNTYKKALDTAKNGTSKLSDSTNTMTKKFDGAKKSMQNAYSQAIKFDTNNAQQGKLVKDGIDKIANSTKNLGSNASDASDKVAELRDQLAQLDKGSGSSGKNNKNEDKKYKVVDENGKTKASNLSKSDADKKAQILTDQTGGGKTFDVEEMATGGYTGEWTNSGNNKEGRLALLHEKELVLNKEDTQNILQAVSMQRELASIGRLPNLNAQPQPQNIEQNVNINAEFPSVNNQLEIQEAFNGMKAQAISYISNKD